MLVVQFQGEEADGGQDARTFMSEFFATIDARSKVAAR